jgi:hypothetical protein
MLDVYKYRTGHEVNLNLRHLYRNMKWHEFNLNNEQHGMKSILLLAKCTGTGNGKKLAQMIEMCMVEGEV